MRCSQLWFPAWVELSSWGADGLRTQCQYKEKWHRAPASRSKGRTDVLHRIFQTSSPGWQHSPELCAPAAATGECSLEQEADSRLYQVLGTVNRNTHHPSFLQREFCAITSTFWSNSCHPKFPAFLSTTVKGKLLDAALFKICPNAWWIQCLSVLTFKPPPLSSSVLHSQRWQWVHLFGVCRQR